MGVAERGSLKETYFGMDLVRARKMGRGTGAELVKGWGR